MCGHKEEQRDGRKRLCQEIDKRWQHGNRPSFCRKFAGDFEGKSLRHNVNRQLVCSAGLSQRLAYYTASLYVSQIGEGDDYTLLRPAISICVLDAILFRTLPQIHSDFRLRNRNGTIELTEGMQIHVLELPKYTLPSDNRVITDPVEAWCYFFRRADEMTAAEIRQRFSSSAFNEAAEVLEMIRRTPEQRSQYELRLKAQRDERARMQYAVEQARKAGKAEGEAFGRIEVLRELLGLDQTSVAELSIEQLAALETDLKRQLRERGI